jgi:hypothetical protein
MIQSVTDRTEHPGRARDHGQVMLRRLSLTEHGAVELVVGLALIAAPFALGYDAGGLLASMAAGAVLVGLGLSDPPISAHMTADFVVAALLLVLAIGSGDRVAGGVLAIAAAGELLLSVATRWTRRESRAR